MSVLVWSLIIFFGRIIDVALGTLRVRMIIRGKKFIAALIGFVEVSIFILLIAKVISDISVGWPALAYAAGFATGTWLGIYINEKLGNDRILFQIISPEHWEELIKALSEANFGVTTIPGAGIQNTFMIIEVVLFQNRKSEIEKIVTSIDPKAFIIEQELQRAIGGHVYGLKSKI